MNPKESNKFILNDYNSTSYVRTLTGLKNLINLLPLMY